MRLRLGFWPVGDRQLRRDLAGHGHGFVLDGERIDPESVRVSKCICSKHAWNPECPVHPPHLFETQVRR